MNINASGNRRQSGSAMVEMAIMLPAYLVMLFGLLYFGYSTLASQKEDLASAYAVLQPGTQTADELLPAFFPWHGAVDAAGPTQDGTEAHAGEATLRVADGLLTGAAYNLDDVTVALWVLALGEVIQRFEWRNGEIVEVIDQHLDDAARYLQGNEITIEGAPHAPTDYTRWVTGTLNAENTGANWLERRTARLEYAYEPFYLPHVVGGEQPLAQHEYMTLSFPDPDRVPIQTRGHLVATRGEAERLGARDPGSDATRLLSEMAGLVGRGGDMLPPMTDDDLESLRSLLAKSRHIWVAE